MIVAGDGANWLHEKVTMPEPTTLTSVAPGEGRSTDTNLSAVRSFTSAELMRYGWPSIYIGIALAGALYPIVVGLGYVAVRFCVMLLQRGAAIDWNSAVMLLISGPMFAIMTAMVGFVWSSGVAAVTLPIVHMITWSLKLRVGLVQLGAFSGGLVGFIAILPMTLNMGQDWEALMMILVGPGITTLLGQLGGAWGGWRTTRTVGWYERAVALASVSQDQGESYLSMDDDTRATHDIAGRLQFSIRHLLWIAVWCSLLLTVIRLSGIPFHYVLPMLLGWLAYQAATLWFGSLLARRLGPWYNRGRQIRST